jgi:tetratricopeptide (TPR) repeat protein
MTLESAGRSAEAIEAYRSALELAPERGVTRAHLALSLLALGRGEEALTEAMAEPDSGFRLWALAIVHGSLGNRPESERSLQELIEKHGHLGAQQVAQAYASRGESDDAFAWLERSFEQRDSGIIETLATRTFSSLHSDPRWKPFLMKIGLLDS